MNGRQAKKLRQLARREKDKTLVAMYDDIQSALKDLVKPAPMWFPVKLWRAMAKVFLNI